MQRSGIRGLGRSLITDPDSGIRHASGLRSLHWRVRLAGHGFVVAAPEIYHRRDPQGLVIPFDDEGRSRGMDNAAGTAVAVFDVSAGSVLDHLARDPNVGAGQFGVAGFCLGGHLAFRAAFGPEVKATVCFDPTGIHTGTLGRDDDASASRQAVAVVG